MKSKSRSTILGLCTAGMLAAACSTGPSHQGTSGTQSNTAGGGSIAPASESIGAVGMDLTLPGGQTLGTVYYNLSNGTNTYTGNYNITNANTISFVIGSVAAGSGYEIQVWSTTTDGRDICSYPSPVVNGTLVDAGPLSSSTVFNVVNRTTTVVDLNMQCVNQQGLDAGSVLVNTVQSNCPVWDTIVANPLNVTVAGDGTGGANVNDSGSAGTSNAFIDGGVNPSQPLPASIVAQIADGQQLVVVGSGTGPDPANLTFTWTITNPDADGEHLDSVAADASAPGSPDPNGNGQPNGQTRTDQVVFTCGGSLDKVYNIQLVMKDGPVPDGGGCDANFTTGVVQVHCQSLAPCSTMGGMPANPATSSTGTCPTGTVNSGNPSSGATGTPVGTDPQGNYCCVTPCGGNAANESSNYPSGTGGCGTGKQNDGYGCCIPLLTCTAGKCNASSTNAGAACTTNTGSTGCTGTGAACTPVDSNGSANCVQCTNRTPAICTGTEAIFLGLDITSGAATSGGAPPPTGCYAGCLIGAPTCLDIPAQSKTNRECEDLGASTTWQPGTCSDNTVPCGTSADCIAAGSPAGTTCIPYTGEVATNAVQDCLNVATCVAGNTCLTSQAGGATYCFCGAGAWGTGGSAGPTNCSTHGGSINNGSAPNSCSGTPNSNGACESVEAAGFKDLPCDTSDVIKDWTDNAQPSGMANAIVGCAAANVGAYPNCSKCL